MNSTSKPLRSEPLRELRVEGRPWISCPEESACNLLDSHFPITVNVLLWNCMEKLLKELPLLIVVKVILVKAIKQVRNNWLDFFFVNFFVVVRINFAQESCFEPLDPFTMEFVLSVEANRLTAAFILFFGIDSIEFNALFNILLDINSLCCADDSPAPAINTLLEFLIILVVFAKINSSIVCFKKLLYFWISFNFMKQAKDLTLIKWTISVLVGLGDNFLKKDAGNTGFF